MFEQLVKEVISDISQREDRQRNRRDDAQHHFEYAVRYLLTDLWKASKSIPFRECSRLIKWIFSDPNQSVIETLI